MPKPRKPRPQPAIARKIEQREALRSMVRQLLHLRDEELRRIAGQMNALTQYHAAMILHLDRLSRPETTPGQAAELTAQSLKLLQRCVAETQSLASLLYPQALEKKADLGRRQRDMRRPLRGAPA
jgi:hypothetical protein